MSTKRYRIGDKLNGRIWAGDDYGFQSQAAFQQLKNNGDLRLGSSAVRRIGNALNKALDKVPGGRGYANRVGQAMAEHEAARKAPLKLAGINPDQPDATQKAIEGISRATNVNRTIVGTAAAVAQAAIEGKAGVDSLRMTARAPRVSAPMNAGTVNRIKPQSQVARSVGAAGNPNAKPIIRVEPPIRGRSDGLTGDEVRRRLQRNAANPPKPREVATPKTGGAAPFNAEAAGITKERGGYRIKGEHIDEVSRSAEEAEVLRRHSGLNSTRRYDGSRLEQARRRVEAKTKVQSPSSREDVDRYTTAYAAANNIGPSAEPTYRRRNTPHRGLDRNPDGSAIPTNNTDARRTTNNRISSTVERKRSQASAKAANRAQRRSDIPSKPANAPKGGFASDPKEKRPGIGYIETTPPYTKSDRNLARQAERTKTLDREYQRKVREWREANIEPEWKRPHSIPKDASAADKARLEKLNKVINKENNQKRSGYRARQDRSLEKIFDDTYGEAIERGSPLGRQKPVYTNQNPSRSKRIADAVKERRAFIEKHGIDEDILRFQGGDRIDDWSVWLDEYDAQVPANLRKALDDRGRVAEIRSRLSERRRLNREINLQEHPTLGPEDTVKTGKGGRGKNHPNDTPKAAAESAEHQRLYKEDYIYRYEYDRKNKAHDRARKDFNDQLNADERVERNIEYAEAKEGRTQRNDGSVIDKLIPGSDRINKASAKSRVRLEIDLIKRGNHKGPFTLVDLENISSAEQLRIGKELMLRDKLDDWVLRNELNFGKNPKAGEWVDTSNLTTQQRKKAFDARDAAREGNTLDAWKENPRNADRYSKWVEQGLNDPESPIKFTKRLRVGNTPVDLSEVPQPGGPPKRNRIGEALDAKEKKDRTAAVESGNAPEDWSPRYNSKGTRVPGDPKRVEFQYEQDMVRAAKERNLKQGRRRRIDVRNRQGRKAPNEQLRYNKATDTWSYKETDARRVDRRRQQQIDARKRTERYQDEFSSRYPEQVAQGRNAYAEAFRNDYGMNSEEARTLADKLMRTDNEAGRISLMLQFEEARDRRGVVAAVDIIRRRLNGERNIRGKLTGDTRVRGVRNNGRETPIKDPIAKNRDSVGRFTDNPSPVDKEIQRHNAFYADEATRINRPTKADVAPRQGPKRAVPATDRASHRPGSYKGQPSKRTERTVPFLPLGQRPERPAPVKGGRIRQRILDRGYPTTTELRKQKRVEQFIERRRKQRKQAGRG